MSEEKSPVRFFGSIEDMIHQIADYLAEIEHRLDRLEDYFTRSQSRWKLTEKEDEHSFREP